MAPTVTPSSSRRYPIGRYLLACMTAVVSSTSTTAAPPWIILVSGGAEPGGGGGTAALSFDPDAGSLTVTSSSQLGNGGVGGWMTARSGGSPDALPSLMFATRRTGGTVQSVAVNASGGMIPLGAPQLTGGSDPEHVQFLPPRWVLTANYGNGRVGVQPVGTDGAVGPPLPPTSVGANAHEIAFDPANSTRVFVPCLGADHVAQVRAARHMNACW